MELMKMEKLVTGQDKKQTSVNKLFKKDPELPAKNSKPARTTGHGN
jgi:hypothetical protein